jgi:hypothetical protein
LSADRHAIISCSHVLLPQMKKYRCLWGKSRINHNILYFVRVPDTLLQNSSNCLWKAQNVLARRGLQYQILLRNQMPPRASETSPALQELVKASAGNKSQKQCSLGHNLWKNGQMRQR